MVVFLQRLVAAVPGEEAVDEEEDVAEVVPGDNRYKPILCFCTLTVCTGFLFNFVS